MDAIKKWNLDRQSFYLSTDTMSTISSRFIFVFLYVICMSCIFAASRKRIKISIRQWKMVMYEKYVYSTAANSSSIIKKFSFQLLGCMYELEEKIVIFELCYCYRKKQLHSENRKTHQFLRECQGVNLLNSYEIPLLRGAVRKMRGVSVARGKRKKKWERETTREMQSVAGASRRVFKKIGRFVSW